jgi:hypothetical protein
MGRLLFALNGLIWLLISGLSVPRLPGSNDEYYVLYLILLLLMFANAGAMFVAALWLGARRWLSYLFALALLFGNIVLTFTDQVGFWDLLTLFLDLGILLLLWRRRSDFLFSAV